ncbi:hypothetical protein [Streptomyces sp. LN590]|uniref:hypothetical protein n=1 Tax=Streptomyces sp. LN590 TaxID=3112980 RepID=UPI0037139E77
MATVTFVDETTSGTRQDAWELAMAEERLPLREVIRRRVFQEVYNARQPELFQGLCSRPRPNAPSTATGCGRLAAFDGHA